jgi:CheY-like chemotaxis protein
MTALWIITLVPFPGYWLVVSKRMPRYNQLKEDPMKRSDKVWKFLLVDDGEDDYAILCSQLQEILGLQFDLDWLPVPTDLNLICHLYDAVFVEYQIGVFNGVELIQQIRAMGGKMPILLATDWVIPNKEIWEEAIQAGATFFISKQDANSRLLEHDLCQALPDFAP